jgi:hypothetical protein
MKQLVRAKFMSFGIKVPTQWKAKQGAAADHYDRAFKPEEKQTTPGTPPLFLAATSNKYHTDTQKMLIAAYGEFMDKTCDAICSAWQQWQSAATLVGVVINAAVAAGGQVVGPPLTPAIMLSAPKASPQELKYSNVIATVLGTAWLAYTSTMKVAGMPWYPAFTACPSPVAPPTPNVPCPVKMLNGMFPGMPMPPVEYLKQQMVNMLADPKAPFHAELFEAVSDGFDKVRTVWEGATQVTNVLGTGAVPTYAPPYVPAGPVLGGIGNMTPGGFV